MDRRNKLGVFAGSFSPPHKGHFEVVKRAIDELKPDNFTIFVSSGTRDGITQEDSMKIWGIYSKYLNSRVDIVKGNNIKDVYDYSKNNLDSDVYFVIGYREGNENDIKDIERRTKFNPEKYPNLKVTKISTGDAMKDISGTYSRLISNDFDKFKEILPDELNDNEIKEIYDMISSKNINEGLDNPENMDYRGHIKELTLYAIKNGYNIKPLPSVLFKHNDINNGENFIGKTAYYDPGENKIVLYTFGRDPIAIVNSYSHELIHHIQNLEGRLTNINTENTLDSDELEEIEREAYENGGMLFRNYKDNIRQKISLFEEFRIEEENINFIALEQELDDILEPLGIDAEFTKHFKERCIERKLTEEDIVNLISKIVIKYGDDVAGLKKGENRVFTDVRKLVDIATVTGSYNDDYLKDLIFKTAYKRNSPNEPEFRTNATSPKLKVAEDKFGLNMFMRELIHEIANETPKYKIFCDADGVLSDFDNNFQKYSGGIPPREYEEKMGKEAFWELIDKKIGLEFWEKMEWMNDGHELWNYIKNYNPIILSAPSRDPISSKGKQNWVKNNLPGTKLILAFSDKKKNYAKENYILIDDLEKNCNQWENAGGISILHISAENTIKELKKLGI